MNCHSPSSAGQCYSIERGFKVVSSQAGTNSGDGPSPPLQAFVRSYFISPYISITFDSIATYSYTMSHADTRNKFLAVFEGIREELIAHMKSENMPEDAIAWFNEVTSYMLSTES